MTRPRLDTSGVIARLGEFDAVLRGVGLRHGPEAWQAAHDLLLALGRKHALPQDPRALAPLLGPLFCRNQAEQARFAGLFRSWVSGEPERATLRLNAPAAVPAVGWWRRAARIDRRWRIALALAAISLIAWGLWTALRTSPDTAPAAMPAPSPPPVAAADPSIADTGPAIPIDDWAPPRRLPVWSGIPPGWTGWFAALDRGSIGLPLFGALGFIAWRYRPRTVLRREKSDTETALNRLRIDAGPLAPFAGPASAAALQELRAASWEPTRRLDLAATVEATAHRAGYFQPRYRWRRTTPAFLVLVRSVHRDDQAAAFGEELVRRFEQAGLNVSAFRFREDPRHLVYWSGAERRTTSLDRLWSEHADARLIVVSEGRILFHPLTGAPRDWLPDLQRWERRAWLTTARVDAGLAHWLWSRDFLLLPLRGLSLEALAAWFSAADRRPLPDLAGDAAGGALPDAIAAEPLRWLDPQPPCGVDASAVLTDLRSFLGADGHLLLQAAAVYPEPRWALTQALDYLLFPAPPGVPRPVGWFMRLRRVWRPAGGRPGDVSAGLAAGDSRREARLGRLSRLPWFRHGYMPDYLRETLLRQLSRKHRRRIRQCYELILDRLGPGQDGSDATELVLPIAVSNARRARRRLRELFRGRGRGGTLDDPIFANILRGGRLGPLDFRLPRRMEKRIPGGRLLVNLTPGLLALIAGGALAWGMNLGWHRWGEAALADLYQRRIKVANAGWKVGIEYRPDTFLLAQSLRQRLAAQGFIPAVSSVATVAERQNVLRHPTGAEAVARRAAAEVAQAGFGAPVDLRQDNKLPEHEMRLTLTETYRAGAVFRDAAVNPVGALRPVAFSVFHDRLSVPDPASTSGGTLEVHGPALVALPGGSLRMGCVEESKDCLDREKPVHEVTIKPFALGRYEVAFEDYDRFAADVQQRGGCIDDRGQPLDLKIEMPDDNRWGRGRRPVINVNWDQARCYAQWLSMKTGQHYRLPTEAEWEYAVRAGAETAWYWGDNGDGAAPYAWYGENSNATTHPSGDRRPNAFGLYDMSGNVWEWTADCWHGSYQEAPPDGSAWLAANQGDCGLRVVRGGSWYNYPQGLRSAYRIWIRTDGADDLLGFRVAREW